MELIKELTRNEMKNIMAGEAVPGVEGDCQWNGCEEASWYYNCLKLKCTDWYFGAEADECVRTVNSAHESMLYQCNMDYG